MASIECWWFSSHQKDPQVGTFSALLGVNQPSPCFRALIARSDAVHASGPYWATFTTQDRSPTSLSDPSVADSTRPLCARLLFFPSTSAWSSTVCFSSQLSLSGTFRSSWAQITFARCPETFLSSDPARFDSLANLPPSFTATSVGLPASLVTHQLPQLSATACWAIVWPHSAASEDYSIRDPLCWALFHTPARAA